ncbi:Transcriptional regulator, TetR family [Sphingobium indicum BiD32]|uniref:Transcriptional regulator, TetR family n=1 Tax=Sphingobium indicum BiD32 TaxID=1301087 RepID=N1MQ58_9SPHN|nr:TetR/AcrR family transcriptional regulator [Sphingobium indicum]CCW19066.1 Transcriptional regulator, TetR family [Sphingobium indicum BiD32]
MNERKRHHILDRALEVFFRYGFKRVSMNEIAEAAGISRPGLYLYFQSKEQVFSEALARQGTLLVDEISSNLGAYESASAKLLYAFEVWTVSTFDRNKNSPEAQEIVDATPHFARDAHKAVYEKFESLLAAVVADAGTDIQYLKLSPSKVAHILSSAMRGFKIVAKDGAELRRMLKGLIALTLRTPES